MRYQYLVALILSCRCFDALGQTNVPTFTIYAENIKDKFEIYITQPEKLDSGVRYTTVYYLDANLKSGKKLRELLAESPKNLKNTIFIGIGHVGNYHVLRRRDFITPFIREGDSLVSHRKDFGHAEDFYLFLKNELIPLVDSLYPTNRERMILGHSLGGLFVFYCLFKNQCPFNQFAALSPALWINHYNIFDFEKKYHSKNNTLNANLYWGVGARESLNKIKRGGRKMLAVMEERQYVGLKYSYQELKGRTHNSAVGEELWSVLLALQK